MTPIEISLGLIGLVLGAFINFSIYAFAYFPRSISPWQRPPESIANRSWVTRLPILGWWFRHNEASEFGRWFWVRPMLIEIAAPICIVLLYRYVIHQGLIPTGGMGVVSTNTLWHQFLACAILICLMTAATFIDFDERTIPDLITIPGTLVGMLGAVMVPDWRLIEVGFPVPPALVGSLQSMHANSPFDWSLDWNSGMPGDWGLYLGLMFWSGWCFAMADRRWIGRRGWKKALLYFVEVLRRSPSTLFLATLWGVGSVLIAIAYWNLDVVRWEALLSSLFGIGLGGILVWGFRLVARWALGQEALGFGDVTLMSMIGAFFGWQIVWISFFLAPFFGMLFVLVAWVITRDNATPFGPYLCAATLYAILDWSRVWEWTSNWFLPPSLVLMALVVLLAALGIMLWAVHWLKMQLLGTPRETRR
jgi:prepilin signal peptidase PulO-like enzyme (type II secretory pathway)